PRFHWKSPARSECPDRGDRSAAFRSPAETRARQRLYVVHTFHRSTLDNIRDSSVDAVLRPVRYACWPGASLRCRWRKVESVRAGDLVHVHWTEAAKKSVRASNFHQDESCWSEWPGLKSFAETKLNSNSR